MQAQCARLAAPSSKSWAIAGHRNVLKRGHRPVQRVVIAEMADGSEFVHSHIFEPSELEKAMNIVRKLRQGASIDPKLWRKIDRREY